MIKTILHFPLNLISYPTTYPFPNPSSFFF